MDNIRIAINGVEVSVAPGKTILDAVNESGLDTIPTLCYDKRIEHFTSCYMCVVQVEGINKLIPSCSTRVSSGMKVWTRNENILATRKTALELLMSNHYADCVGPCTANCPAGVDAQAYIALISMGRYKEALRLVKENNPLPMSIGRVCVRDCEAACRRKLVDEPVAINTLKRFIADYDNVNKWTPEIKERRNKKIAVIGGGPAGLSCAYYLVIEGYDVTIFEKLPRLGGMLRYGIPEYRLPREVLDSEIEWIMNLGIKARTGVELGKDFSLKDLHNDNFEAVFIAVGAHKASRIGLEGEDSVKGVYRGIEFLREIGMERIPRTEGKVIVCGGGNTAIDAARSALRCGASSVKIVYRRSIKEMPARSEEVEAAIKEGVEILFLTNPVSILSVDNKLRAIECIKMQLEETRPGERPKPVPVPGSGFTIECDYLIGAIGQGVDKSFANYDAECCPGKSGTISVNNNTLETTIPGVFAGGDAVTGPLTAISSIAQGKKAAMSIMEYLEKGIVKGSPGKYYSLKHKLSDIKSSEYEDYKKKPREKMPELPLEERINCFSEVELGIKEQQAKSEVKRCLECGCQEYYNCQLRKYCDEYGINVSRFSGEIKKYRIDERHPFISLNPNKCIDCGRCVRTCNEILKVSALGFVYRGFNSVVKPAMEKSLMDTNCISCGNCIDACPTGAISERLPFKVPGTLPKEDYETICSFCSAGCKVNYKKVSNDIFYVSDTTEQIKDSHNKGYLCAKGRFGYRYLLSKNRIMSPVINRKGQIQEAGMDEVLQYTRDRLISIIRRYGKDSIAVMASPRLSNEELYLLQKFVRAGLKNNNISSFTVLSGREDLRSLDEMLGFTLSTVSMDRLSEADVIIAINSNLADDNPVLELKIKQACKGKTKLVMINSTESKLTRYSDLWIDSRKGTNTYLLNGIMNSLIEAGLTDDNFIQGRTRNFSEARSRYAAFTKEEASSICGVEKSRISSLISMVSDPGKKIIFLYNIDSSLDKSANDMKAIGNFMLLTGRMGKPGNGIIILRDYSNSAGQMEMGAYPDYLPGCVRYNEAEEINRIGQAWNTDLRSIFKSVDLENRMRHGAIKGMLIFGEDPLAVKENWKYLNKLELLLVSEAFSSNTASVADVVIPAASHIEQSGSYTRCDNRIQKAIRITDGVSEISNWQVISRLAKLFSPGFEYASSAEIIKEIETVDRFLRKTKDKDSRIEQYLSEIVSNKSLPFLEYQAELTSYNSYRPAIHYQDYYYLCNIKNKLT